MNHQNKILLSFALMTDRKMSIAQTMRMIKISDHLNPFYNGDYFQSKDWGDG